MIIGAWAPPLVAAFWSVLTGAVSVILVLTELGDGRPVQIPRISDASIASPSTRVAFIILGVFSAAFLWAAAATVYTVILTAPHAVQRRRRRRADGGGVEVGVPPPTDSPSVPSAPPVPRWLSGTALLCAAVASVGLVVASSTDVFSDAHDNAVEVYVVAELVWLAVVLAVLHRGRARTGAKSLAAAVTAIVGVTVAVAMLVVSLILLRNETAGVSVVTPETLAARERVPADVNAYFNVFSLGEYIFLVSLSAFNLCLAWALRHDRVHFGPPAAAVGVGGRRGGGSLSSSSISSDDEADKAGAPAAAVPAAAVPAAVAPAAVAPTATFASPV